MNRKFKIGDRVRLVGDSVAIWSDTTLTATIVEQHENYQSQNYTLVFDHNPNLGKTPCYNFKEHGLELLEVYESPLYRTLNEN